MTDWIKLSAKVTNAIDDALGKIKREISACLGIEDPVNIMPYRGYGTRQWLRISGRVLQDEGIKLQEEDAPLWENLWNMYRRFESDEVPGARLRIRVGDVEQETTSDDEGFYYCQLNFDSPLEPIPLWQPVELTLLSPMEGDQPLQVQGEAIVVGEKARFGVISDIDDTVMYTAATDMLKMIRIAYMGNERTRRPFAGVPEFYQALQRGVGGSEGNPIFYVSSSAWNMYDLFEKFMDFNQVPGGPVLLREIELSLENWLSFDHRLHKREHIDPIMTGLPDLPFILIGDSGQKDAEIYRKLVVDYPGRIQAVYIRNVTPHDLLRLRWIEGIAQEIAEAGSQLILFEETEQAYAHAAEQGWIAPKSTSGLSPVAAEQR